MRHTYNCNTYRIVVEDEMDDLAELDYITVKFSPSYIYEDCIDAPDKIKFLYTAILMQNPSENLMTQYRGILEANLLKYKVLAKFDTDYQRVEGHLDFNGYAEPSPELSQFIADVMRNHKLLYAFLFSYESYVEVSKSL